MTSIFEGQQVETPQNKAFLLTRNLQPKEGPPFGFQVFTHTIHGTGIFTYMNGGFLWFSCR